MSSGREHALFFARELFICEDACDPQLVKFMEFVRDAACAPASELFGVMSGWDIDRDVLGHLLRTRLREITRDLVVVALVEGVGILEQVADPLEEGEEGGDEGPAEEDVDDPHAVLTEIELVDADATEEPGEQERGCLVFHTISPCV